MNGSTDRGNVDDEVFMVVWCDVASEDEKIHTKTTYFHVCRPNTVNAAGLFEALKDASLKLGICFIKAWNM